MEEVNKFKSFIIGNIRLLVVTYLVIGLSFGAKIFYYNYSIDSEEFLIFAPRNGFIQWAQMGRYGLFFLKKYVFGYSLNVFFINVFTYLLLGVMTIFICYILYILYGERKKGLWIIPMIFVSSPILLEQYNFILQSLEVVISNLIVCISVYCVYLYTCNKKLLILVISTILGVCSFSVYPSNYVTFVVLAIVIILSLVNNSEKELTFIYILETVVPYVSVFIIAFFSNNFFYRISMKLLNVEKISYVESSIPWGKIPVREIFKSMVTNVDSVYKGNQTIFINKITFLLFLLSFIITLLIKKNKLWLLLLLTFLFISANSSFLILGGIGPIRALTPYFPIALAFICFFMYVNIKNIYTKNLFTLGIILISLYQIKLTSFFSNQESIIFNDELNYSQELVIQLNNLGLNDIKKYKLAIYGNKDFPSSQPAIYGDVLGNGFYNWDATGPVGSTNRIANFLENNGYPTERITPEEYKKVLPNLKELSVFPEKDSIKIEDDIILIRIS